VVASPNSVIYGSSVVLTITSASLNPSFDNLTTKAFYTAYIYGGGLDAGVTIPLYSEHPCPHAFQGGTLA
jgi:hypothetical protein